MFLVRLMFVLVAVLLAVVMLKVIVAVALVGALAFAALYTINLGRRLLRGAPSPAVRAARRPMRRVMPLAGPRITARR